MDTELKVFPHKGQMMFTSLNIAEAMGKRHSKVMHDIANLRCGQEFWDENYELNSYYDKQGKKRPMYYLTKGGVMILVMGYKGKKAGAFKEACIKRFNEMREELGDACRL